MLVTEWLLNHKINIKLYNEVSLRDKAKDLNKQKELLWKSPTTNKWEIAEETLNICDCCNKPLINNIFLNAERHLDCDTELYKNVKSIPFGEIKPKKYDWGENLKILEEGRYQHLEKGDVVAVSLVDNTGFNHFVGWKTWKITNSFYCTTTVTFDIPRNTTVVGIITYKDGKVVASNKLPVQKFVNEGTYTINFTYNRRG